MMDSIRSAVERLANADELSTARTILENALTNTLLWEAPPLAANRIDHTALKADVDRDTVVALCREARTYGFFSVCVNTDWVPLASEALEDSTSVVCCVIGFPLGAMGTEAKAFETRWAVERGAQEVDMVLAVGRLKGREYCAARDDIAAVVEAAGDARVKVILETCLLDETEIALASALAVDAGAAFVKTSTGFGAAGATPAHLALMRQVVGPDVGVKASGGVRTAADARSMLAAGADRLGASASIAIVSA